jgi:hypothetical protein
MWLKPDISAVNGSSGLALWENDDNRLTFQRPTSDNSRGAD